MGRFTASDPESDAITFSLAPRDGSEVQNPFQMEQNGTLRAAKSFDYETDEHNYTITIVAKDEYNATTEVNFTITLLNVVEDIPNWAAVELPRGILEKSKQSSLEKLKALASSSNVEVEVEVRVGHPYKTILEVADERSAELIVVASHQPALQNYFLGSTAAKVVRHATCSVLVVR